MRGPDFSIRSVRRDVMLTHRFETRFALAATTAALLLATTCPAGAAVTPALACQAAKNAASGKFVFCLQKAEMKYVRDGEVDAAARDAAQLECGDKAVLSFFLAERKAEFACPSLNDQAEVQPFVEACTLSVETALAGGTLTEWPACITDLGECSQDAANTQADVTACETDLAACETELPACNADVSSTGAALTTCSGNLTATNADLGACQGTLAGCNAALSSTESVLDACNDDLTVTSAVLAACNGVLGGCNANLSATNVSLNACNNDLPACNSAAGTCEDDVAACNAQAAGCQASVSTCSSGTAVAADVLAGRTFSSSSGLLQSGAMVNRGATVLVPTTTAQAIPAGYHNGSGYCAGDSELIGRNIATGKNIFGVNGTLPASAGGLTETGQTICYADDYASTTPCAGTGQDGELRRGHAPTFSDNGDGTITDGVTGLMWEKLSNDGGIHSQNGTYTWTNSVSVKIAALNSAGFGGYSDWRLPSVSELSSLTDYGASNPSIFAPFHSGCAANCSSVAADCSCMQANGYYWTSTLYSGAGGVWGIWGYDGRQVQAAASTQLYVRAVRGGV